MDEDTDRALQEALDRLALLSAATTALASTLDADAGMRRVARTLVPQLGDWCAVHAVAGETVREVAVVHRDPDRLADAGVGDASFALPVAAPAGRGPLARALRGEGPLLVPRAEFPSPEQPGGAHEREPAPYDRFDTETLLVAPLLVRREVLGALMLGRGRGREPFGPEHLSLLQDLAHRIGLSLDNSRLHRETQRIAERLQRSLLPPLPAIAPLGIAAGYQPSQTTAEVGGDWYDCFVLPQGDIALIIGDVTGHDLQAAVMMSQLRNMLRGVACDRQEPAGRILSRLDRASHTLHPGTTATCVYALLTEEPGGQWAVEWSRAGHPPPLLVTADGDSRYLDASGGLPLGVSVEIDRTEHRTPLPAGSTLLLYTDGLVERRGEVLDRGMTRLRREVSSRAGEPVEALVEQLLHGMGTGADDDVALLAVRMP
ncbi:PP2C family protein-serine/threonine phosphatase [Streptomyces sp. NRRL F-5123]|uniref:PP2C family protein-serine/threonine phosphatase n=1 Tax=Streptomyces sp. NRRL F-5123 TaxID=1463856 RepID=UPI0004E27F3E|nr:GAF domain-containing SpoIIE family protein phosphatase [Streptomyces sp. NRRL F-5123]